VRDPKPNALPGAGIDEHLRCLFARGPKPPGRCPGLELMNTFGVYLSYAIRTPALPWAGIDEHLRCLPLVRDPKPNALP
jgi:hypothetical protein